MRPLKLRMGGFGAFREGTEVDFTGVELAALVGSTGSGKSTIIDWTSKQGASPTWPCEL